MLERTMAEANTVSFCLDNGTISMWWPICSCCNHNNPITHDASTTRKPIAPGWQWARTLYSDFIEIPGYYLIRLVPSSSFTL